MFLLKLLAATVALQAGTFIWFLVASWMTQFAV